VFQLDSNKSSTIVSHLAERLRRDIIFGVLDPNTRLKIEDLRRTYGGSANSLREALTSLVSLGLVESADQRGFRVASMTEADLRDVNRLRQEIECLGLTWSLKSRSVEWEANLIAAYHRLSAAEQAVEPHDLSTVMTWDEANRLFHRALSEGGGSVRLLQIQERLYVQSARFRLAQNAEKGDVNSRSVDEHKAILDAIMEKKGTDAVAILRRHIAWV